ncbi:MAG: 2-iminoacetate synthase ThiH [Desulfobacterales bacterium]|nr:2-iminoacetate synthase ThiH [Desulfobacterales bacterium]
MSDFYEISQGQDWNRIKQEIFSKKAYDVESALDKDYRTLDDFFALLSPSAEVYLEDMAHMAHQITVQRFGKIILMFAPLYLSNECTNACIYCGFNRNNSIQRMTLTVEQVLQEAMSLYQLGFRHILLVSGEATQKVNMDYLKNVVEKLRDLFASISIEIYPMSVESYSVLIEKGVDGLTVYQETYHPERYHMVHGTGPKQNYSWRINTPDRGGIAGFRRINIGVLLGLYEWQIEAAFIGLHAEHLIRTYWKSHIGISFPRLRPAAGGYMPEYIVNDKNIVQLICALRLFLPDAGLVLSTRESSWFRDNVIPLGITQMSAGSKTAPGGYTLSRDIDGQFEIEDSRTPEQVVKKIITLGYDPVWKDWDVALI